MADQVLAKAVVEVTADMSALDATMESLPARLARKAAEARQRLEGELSRVRLDMQVAGSGGGAAELNRLAAAEAQLQAKIQACNVAFGNQMAAMGRHATAARAAATQTQTLNAGMAGIQASSGRGASGLLMVAQITDDIQYGFKAVVNQIPQAGMALGQAMGMSAEKAMAFAGALGIVGVAVSQLINHWGELTDAFGMTVISSHAEEMAHLAAATHLTAEQQARLNDLKREEATIKRLDESRPEEVSKQASEVEKAIGEGPEANIVKGLAELRNPGGFAGKLDVEEQKIYADIKKDRDAVSAAGHTTNDADAALEELMAKARQRAIDEVKQSLAAAVNDPTGERLKGIVNEMERNPKAFPKGAIDRLKDLTPEGKKAKQEKDFADEADTDFRRLESQNEKAREEGDEERFLEGNREAAEARKRREQKAGEVARGLESGAAGRRFDAGDLGEAEVENALKGAGYTDPAKMGRRVAEVMDKLSEDYLEKVAKVAQAEGVDGATAQRILARQAGLADAQEALKQSQADAGVSQAEKALRQAQFGTASFQGTEQMLKNIQLGAFDDPEKDNVQVLKDQLKVAEETRDLLKGKGGAVAVAG